MLGESVQVEHTNTRRTAAAAMAVAGQDAQIHPSPALKTYHFQWSGFMMMWEENIGCTGRVSPLQLQVTYINITLTTLICPLQPRTKTSAVGPRETQGPTMLTTHHPVSKLWFHQLAQVGKSINNFGILPHI